MAVRFSIFSKIGLRTPARMFGLERISSLIAKIQKLNLELEKMFFLTYFGVIEIIIRDGLVEPR